MIIEDLSAFLATVLAVSLATERLVVVAKTASPIWLADEKKTAAAEVDLLGDRWRRLRVHLVAFLTAWLIASSMADFDFLRGRVALGSTTGASVHVLVLALLSMGGSAFWTSIVGYASAAKDIRMQARASESLSFQAKAKEQGKVPVDSGIAAVGRGTSAATNLGVVLRRVMILDQPQFGAEGSRVAGDG